MYTTNNGRTLNVTLRHYVDGVMHFEDLQAETHILDWQVAGLQKTAFNVKYFTWGLEVDILSPR